MELNYDWKEFQSLFYPPKKISQRTPATPVSPVFLIKNGDVIVSAFSENENLLDWVGASYKETGARNKHREFLVFEKKEVQTWFDEVVSVSHFYEQVELFRKKSQEKSQEKYGEKSQKNSPKNSQDKFSISNHFSNHFLLDGIQSWWNKIFPSTFGILIKMTGMSTHTPKGFFLTIQSDSVKGFEISESSLTFSESVKIISKKQNIPIQGFEISFEEWTQWMQSEEPWKEVLKAIRSKRVKMFPFRLSLLSLIAVRAYLGI